jgi:hypothetical protein
VEQFLADLAGAAIAELASKFPSGKGGQERAS